MPYVDVEWTGGVDAGGDETKLDTMAANVAFLRTDLDYLPVAQAAGYSEGGAGSFAGASATTPVRFALSGAFGTVGASDVADGGAFSLGFSDKDLFGTPVGQVSELSLWVEADLGSSTWTPVAEVGRFWYVRSADEDRLRIGGTGAVHANDWYVDAGSSPVANKLWGQMFGFNVTSYLLSSGDSRWSSVAFDGPTPGPAELVSDTDMNQIKTNQDVVRDRLRVRHVGSNACSDIGHAQNWGGSLEVNHGLRFQLFVAGQLVGTVTTPFSPHTVWTTFSIKNRLLPISGWNADAILLELRVQYANQSSPTLWVGHDGSDGGAVGADGWLVASTHFWSTPEDKYVHAFVAPRTFRGYDQFLNADANFVAFKTLGVAFIVTNGTLP